MTILHNFLVPGRFTKFIRDYELWIENVPSGHQIYLHITVYDSKWISEPAAQFQRCIQNLVSCR